MIRWIHEAKILNQKGFGLIELLVAIGIITLITSTILVRQSAFNSTVLLENQAWEIATDIRQAQNLAASPQRRSGDDFRGQYGISFTANTQTYTVFHLPDGSTSPVNIGRPFSLDPRFVVSSVSANNPTGTNAITDTAVIRFERPNFDAQFFNGDSNQVIADSVTVTIQPRGDAANAREITVSSTGQITVNRP